MGATLHLLHGDPRNFFLALAPQYTLLLFSLLDHTTTSVMCGHGSLDKRRKSEDFEVASLTLKFTFINWVVGSNLNCILNEQRNPLQKDVNGENTLHKHS